MELDLISSAQRLVVLVLGLGALGLEVFALVDAARHRPEAYVAAGKRSKTFWTVVTGVAALIGFVTVGSPQVLGLVGILAVVAAGVYLADVRPALRQVTGRGPASGPYGPW
jgi:hypothetical protein